MAQLWQILAHFGIEQTLESIEVGEDQSRTDRRQGRAQQCLPEFVVDRDVDQPGEQAGTPGGNEIDTVGQQDRGDAAGGHAVLPAKPGARVLGGRGESAIGDRPRGLVREDDVGLRSEALALLDHDARERSLQLVDCGHPGPGHACGVRHFTRPIARWSLDHLRVSASMKPLNWSGVFCAAATVPRSRNCA